MKNFIGLFFALSILTCEYSNATPTNKEIVEFKVIDGDTVYLSVIEPVYVVTREQFNSRREYRRYTRLIRNVKKAYPYAVLAREEYARLEKELAKLDNPKEQKQEIKKTEKYILDEYEEKLKNLTITQGRILIKLIDRELDNTSYDLVKELKGSVSALFWQALARMFGSNLKTEYDPLNEDKDIEEIIQLIEQGLI